MSKDHHTNSRQWRLLRQVVLQRDGGVCTIKLPGCLYNQELQIHHTVGVEVSGLLCDPSLLTTACRVCNRAVGKPKGNPPHKPSNTKW